MAKFDSYHSAKCVRCIDAVDVAAVADVVGEVVDTQFFESVVLYFSTGDINDLVATVLVEQCATSGGVYVAVPDTQLIGVETDLTLAADDDNKIAQLGVLNNLRFVRVTLQPSAASGVNIVSAVAVLGSPHEAPVIIPSFN